MNKVLIVDADKYARVKFSCLLSECECEVETADTPPEAARRLAREHFDCVILDVESSDPQGYEIIAFIRAISPDTEVIATTSTNSRRLETRTRGQGIFYYYIKSFDVEELKQAVNSALRRHERGMPS